MEQQRRADVVWIGDEVKDLERLRRDAKRGLRSIPEEIKTVVKKQLSE